MQNSTRYPGNCFEVVTTMVYCWSLVCILFPQNISIVGKLSSKAAGIEYLDGMDQTEQNGWGWPERKSLVFLAHGTLVFLPHAEPSFDARKHACKAHLCPYNIPHQYPLTLDGPLYRCYPGSRLTQTCYQSFHGGAGQQASWMGIFTLSPSLLSFCFQIPAFLTVLRLLK